MESRRREMNPSGKRDAIMRAGEALFSQKGYSPTTMAQIARQADVAVGTVYRLFPDKAALLVALHKNMEDQFIMAIKTGWAAKDHYPDKFSPMIDSLFDQADAVRETMPLLSLTKDMVGMDGYIPGARMMVVIETLYEEGVASGAFRAFPKGLQAPLAHGLVEGGFRAWMPNPTVERREEITQEMKAMFRRAFVIDAIA